MNWNPLTATYKFTPTTKTIMEESLINMKIQY